MIAPDYKKRKVKISMLDKWRRVSYNKLNLLNHQISKLKYRGVKREVTYGEQKLTPHARRRSGYLWK